MARGLALQHRRARPDGSALIARGLITRVADRDGVTAQVVERDYVLTHVVEALALLPAPGGLVLKGGTALRLCFYEDYRYSADLDFSLAGLEESEAIAVVREALAGTVARLELPLLELSDPPAAIRYIGPLGRERTLKLDLATDELVLEAQASPLLLRYADQTAPPPRITTYTLREVAAEKLRCVIQRILCRDPFDLHHLLVQEGVDIDASWTLFEEKARHKGIDPARFSERLDAREPQYRRRWEREMEEHVGEAPHFPEIMRELRRALRERL